jgi:hypothetical protein
MRPRQGKAVFLRVDFFARYDIIFIMMKKILRRTVVSIAAFALIAPSVTFGAFGISPPFLNADHLVKGATYAQTIYLVQDQPNDDLQIRADLKIPDSIRSWITIDQGFNFVIPKGTRQFPVVVEIKVPADAPLGAYSGNLSFVSVPRETGQVTIALSVQVAINMTVGTGIYKKFTISQVKALDIEEGWNPRVYVKVRNDGNVSESLDGATFELYDKFDSVRLAYIQKSGDFPEIPPFSAQEYTIEFPTDFHIGLGQYWGSVTLYQNEKVISNEKSIFTVLKAGSISGVSARVLRHLKDNGVYYGLGALALALVLTLWMKRRRAA